MNKNRPTKKMIIISIKYATCRIDLKRDKEVIVDIDSPELHQSQYHTADFDTSAYNYGYAVEPNGQFHHETRGGDGVTYGCYGYIDSDDLLKVTHYVADSQGYRTLEHEKPVLVYPIDENAVDPYETAYKPKGVMLDWKDLYFPIGCGMAKGGVLVNVPVVHTPDGHFKQLGEDKFPVPPSNEPKVVVPRIPFNSGIKIEPTKLIPVGRVGTNINANPQPKTTISGTFSSSSATNPQRSTQPPQRSTNSQSTSTKISYNVNVNGPENENKSTYRPSQFTVQPIFTSTGNPSAFGETLSPFTETAKVNEPTTVKLPTNNLKLNKVPSPVILSDSEPVKGQYDDYDGLLPPYRTTNVDDRQTTVSVPLSSPDSDDDLNVINSYANLNPESRATTQSGYVEGITTSVPTQNQTLSNRNNISPYTFPSYKQPDFTSTEKVSTIRPNKFNAFNFNVPTTTNIPTESAEQNPDSTVISTIRPNKFNAFNFNVPTSTNIPTESATEPNPDSTVISTTEAEPNSTPFDFTENPTKLPSKGTSYQTSVKFNSIRHETTGFGVSSSIASQRPVVESSTTPANEVLEIETTTTTLSTYPGIGDYKKPPAGFEFIIPTRAPIQVTTDNFQSFVTNNNLDIVTDAVVNPNETKVEGISYEESKEPDYETVARITKFTNGPHGAEYQLGSRNPHSHYTVSNGRNDYNFNGPIKQSRKETDTNESPIVPTRLTMSDSFPSKNDATSTSSQPDNLSSEPEGFVNDYSSDGPSSSTPLYPNSFNGYGHSSQGVINRYNQNSIQTDREPSRPRPQQPLNFFTVTTPKIEPSLGIITHMNAISQTRLQSSRVTPSLTSGTSNDQQPNELIFNPPSNYYTPDPQTIRQDITKTTPSDGLRSTGSPFLYTRSRTTFTNNENSPYQRDSTKSEIITETPSEEMNTDSGSFGQKIKPGSNQATSSFTAYHQGSTLRPVTDNDVITPSIDQSGRYKPIPSENSLPYQPKFVLRPTARPVVNRNEQLNPNVNGYFDTDNRHANFYPDSVQQKSIEFNSKNNNNLQPESKYINTKKEFIPQYNPNSTPIPGSLGTAIGVYPPNLDELSPEIPNFNIAISKWPFYILPFPFSDANGNIMSFPFFTGMPIQLANGNNFPLSNINIGTSSGTSIGTNIGTSIGSENAPVASGAGGFVNGQPAQSICSWLSSFIKPKQNTTNTEIPTNPDGETLQISNLQVNIKNPQLQFNQNQVNQVPFGIVGFIPIIAVPNCQHNVNGDKSEPSALPTSIQLPSLCSQLSHLIGSQTNPKDTNQPSPT